MKAMIEQLMEAAALVMRAEARLSSVVVVTMGEGGVEVENAVRAGLAGGGVVVGLAEERSAATWNNTGRWCGELTVTVQVMRSVDAAAGGMTVAAVVEVIQQLFWDRLPVAEDGSVMSWNGVKTGAFSWQTARVKLGGRELEAEVRVAEGSLTATAALRAR